MRRRYSFLVSGLVSMVIAGCGAAPDESQEEATAASVHALTASDARVFPSEPLSPESLISKGPKGEAERVYSHGPCVVWPYKSLSKNVTVMWQTGGTAWCYMQLVGAGGKVGGTGVISIPGTGAVTGYIWDSGRMGWIDNAHFDVMP